MYQVNSDEVPERQNFRHRHFSTPIVENSNTRNIKKCYKRRRLLKPAILENWTQLPLNIN